MKIVLVEIRDNGSNFLSRVLELISMLETVLVDAITSDVQSYFQLEDCALGGNSGSNFAWDALLAASPFWVLGKIPQVSQTEILGKLFGELWRDPNSFYSDCAPFAERRGSLLHTIVVSGSRPPWGGLVVCYPV